MATNYVIPKHIQRYLKRVSGFYRQNGDIDLAEVLDKSKFRVIEETDHDNWDGGYDGHDVIFYVPDTLMSLIPLDRQHDIQSKVKEDLNKASTAADREYVNQVHFEYLDDTDPQIARSPSLSSGPEITDETRARLWAPETIKLFISHRDKSKALAHQLAEDLEKFGISSFVAHDSIEPDEDWQNEIEKALQTMDALLAFITDDLFDSPWTNQEIGYALARNIPIISIKIGTIDPVGFIRNRQAIKGSDDMWQNAVKISSVIEKRFSGTPVYRSIVLRRFAQSNSFANAKIRFENVQRLTDLTQFELDFLIGAFNINDQLFGCFALTDEGQFLRFINTKSPKKYELKNGKIVLAPPPSDDEIPF